jgi:hypothetical protein
MPGRPSSGVEAASNDQGCEKTLRHGSSVARLPLDEASHILMTLSFAPDVLADLVPQAMTLAIALSGWMGGKFIEGGAQRLARHEAEGGHEEETIRRIVEPLAVGAVAAITAISTLVSCTLDAAMAAYKPGMAAWITFPVLLLYALATFLFFSVLVNRAPHELAREQIPRLLRWKGRPPAKPNSLLTPARLLSRMTVVLLVLSLLVGLGKWFAASNPPSL